MKPKITRVLTILSLILLMGCAGPLKVTPVKPDSQPDGLIKRDVTRSFEEQLRQKAPGITMSFSDEVELSKAFYDSRNRCLYIPEKIVGRLEYYAVDLSTGKIMWTLKLPKNAILNGLGKTSSGDLWMDVYSNGRTLVFLDPANGAEKWRYGAGQKEVHPLPFKYLSSPNYNFYFGGNSILVQDPSTYQMVSETSRFKTDLQGGNIFKGNVWNCAPFYNSNAIEFDDQYLLLDHGLHAFSKQTGQKQWSLRFPTIATQFHTGQNVGKLIAGAVLGVLTGVCVVSNTAPDIVYPAPLVLKSGQFYYVSALNNLYCVNKATGELNWAADLNLGYTNLITAQDDRIFLISVGDFENCVCNLDKSTGAVIPCTCPVATKKVESHKLLLEDISKLTESGVYAQNSACYDAMVAKKKLIDGEKQLKSAVALQTKIAILAADGLYFLDKSDGQTATTLPTTDASHQNIERIMPLNTHAILALSKSQITCIDTDPPVPAWNLDIPWPLKDLDHFWIDSMSDEYLYVRAVVDKTVEGCILDKNTGAIMMRFDAAQTLFAQKFLAVQNDNRVSIYLQQP